MGERKTCRNLSDCQQSQDDGHCDRLKLKFMQQFFHFNSSKYLLCSHIIFVKLDTLTVFVVNEK